MKKQKMSKDPIELKVIFMGTSAFAAEVLKALLENKYNVVSVYTRPDKKVGRKKELQKSSVKEVAEKNKIKIFQPEKFDEKTVEDLKNQKPDLIVVTAYGRILPKAVLEVPGFGSINVHPSLLPRFRGPSPIQNAILEGEKETGTTIMLMSEEMDAGDILAQEKISISTDETYFDLSEKLASFSAELLLKTLPLWIKRKIVPEKQNDSEASYCQLIERSDGRVVWADDAISIYNRARAFSPWPGIFTFWEKDGCNLRLKLLKAALWKNYSQKNEKKIGEVFEEENKIAVQTSSGALVLEEVQLEGKSKMDIQEFINGYPNFLGSLLK